MRAVQNQPVWKNHEILSNILTSFFKRSQFCFSLATLIIAEVDERTYEKAGLLIGFSLSKLVFDRLSKVKGAVNTNMGTVEGGLLVLTAFLTL